jgi:hypothetical protein
MKIDIGDCTKISRENKNLFKMEQKYWPLYMKTQYLLSLLATLNRHKILLFEWNGIRMVEQPRRYKRYVEEPQGALHVLCFSFLFVITVCQRRWVILIVFNWKSVIQSVRYSFIHLLICPFIYSCFIDKACLWRWFFSLPSKFSSFGRTLQHSVNTAYSY